MLKNDYLMEFIYKAYRFDWLYSPLGLYEKLLLTKLRIHNKMF